MQTNPTTPYAVFLLAGLAFFFVGSIAQSHLEPAVAVLLTQIVAIGGVALAVRMIHPKESFRKVLNAPAVFPCLMIGVTGIYLGLCANLTAGLLIELIPGWSQKAEAYKVSVDLILRPESTGLMIAGAISVVLIAPVCEEALFRGTILPLQREHEGVLAAVLINALLFSLLHANILSFVPLIIVGAFFAHMTLLTGSIWPAVLAHATMNLANGIILPRFADPAAAEPSLTALLIATPISLLILAGIWWWLSCLAQRKRPTDVG